MNVGEFLNTIAVQAGLPEDSAPLKTLLSNPDIVKVDVPEDFKNLFTDKFKGMFTLESAKQNPEIKRHFTQNALAGIDATIERLAKEDFELDDEYITSLKKHDTTGKRLTELAKKVKEFADKKTPTGDDGEKVKKHNEQIRQLNAQLAEQKELFEREKKDIEARFIGNSKERVLKELFQKYEYTDSLPKEVQTEVARSVFNTKLKENNYKIAFDENGDNPRLLTDQDTEVFISNKPVNLNQYVETLLAENKLLKVSKPKIATDGKREPLIVQPANGTSTLNTSAFMQAMESAAQDAARVM